MDVETVLARERNSSRCEEDAPKSVGTDMVLALVSSGIHWSEVGAAEVWSSVPNTRGKPLGKRNHSYVGPRQVAS